MRKKIIVILVIIITGAFLVFFTKQSPPAQEASKGDTNPKRGGFMKISSPAFQNNQDIPSKYTCDEEDINPPLTITGAPAETKSLVLIVDDPDAPAGDWVHWLVWNISPQTTAINENSVPAGAVEGTTDFGRPGWGGPCPPAGKHRYQFKLYALDTELNIPTSYRKPELEKAIQGHVVGQDILMALYHRRP